MHIQQAKQEIKTAVKAYLQKDSFGRPLIPAAAQRPILLMGPPGIGKTAIMEQIAEELKIGLVSYSMTHHTRQSAIGLPMIEKKTWEGQEYTATVYTMSEIIASIYENMKKTGKKEGILFLDEINCVSETLAPVILSLLQKKTFGAHQIPDGWMIAAAGNPPEYNKSVRAFDIVTLDRVRKIDLTADFDVWKQYAYEKGVHQSIITYLEIKPDHFYRVETAASGKNFVTARGWEDLSYMIRTLERLDEPVTVSLIAQYLQHMQIARDFSNYYDLYQRYRDDYQVTEILNGHIREQTLLRLQEARFDEKLSLIGLLMGALNTLFIQWTQDNARISRLYEILLSLRNQPEADQESAANLLREALSLPETADDPPLQEILTTYLRCIEDGGGYETLRTLFAEETAHLDKLAAKIDDMLTHAFAFIAQAFGTGQEMVIFLTELNSSSHAISFLAENASEAYHTYNKQLLFADSQSGLRKEIEQVRPYLN